jgi:dolichol-phosphate mannosyltransferase
MPIKDTVSLIIPTYYEKDNITPLVERIDRALAGYKYEIILVDDNSRDGTIETAEALASRYPVRVIVRRGEKGLATAVVHGLKHASGGIIGIMDADLQHPPEVLPALVRALEDGADMAVASRYIPGGGCPNWGLSRRIISRVALMVSHLCLPKSRPVKDPLTGFFMFRRENIAGADLRPLGYKISLEVMLIGSFRRIVEVPFIFEERSAGQSKLRPRQQIDYLKHIFSLMARTGEINRFLKFIGVGISGTAVNIGVLRLVTAFTSWNPKVQLIPGIEISIITNFLLNDYFTFADRRTGKVGSFIRRLGKYNLIALAGAFINWGTAALLVHTGMNIFLADFIGIVIAFLWNYFFSTVWAWR